jgi:predicted nuclease of predicted toxin-antitoxin system
LNLLADESVEKQIVNKLRNDGHIVDYISEINPGIADDLVLQIATEKKALLVTSDKDFGELFSRLNKLHYGVLLLRLAGSSNHDKPQYVSYALNRYGNKLTGKISVLTPKAIRIH